MENIFPYVDVDNFIILFLYHFVLNVYLVMQLHPSSMSCGVGKHKRIHPALSPPNFFVICVPINIFV